jgi:two-component system response regulator YesN
MNTQDFICIHLQGKPFRLENLTNDRASQDEKRRYPPKQRRSGMSQAIDLLIIEDEAEVLEGIRMVVGLLHPTFRNIYAIGNAEDAKEIIRTMFPRIIVTDIVLPRQSGLELLEEVMQIPGYEPKVVVVSSYNEFSYAQKSLQLGALDYVLKPFDKAEFTRKLQKIVALIQEEDRTSFELKHQAEHARMGTKLLMDQHILGFCTKRTQLQEHIYHRLQLWNLTWLTTSSYHLFAFCVSGDVPERDKEMELQLFAVGNIAAETIQAYMPSYLLRNVHNRWIVISAYPVVEELMDAIRHNVRSYQRLELHCGMSGVMFSFQALAEAYDQAIQALRWATANQLEELSFHDITHWNEHQDYEDVNELCAASLISGDLNGLQQAVHNKVDSLVRFTHIPQRKQLAQSCLDWIIVIQSLVNEKIGIHMDQIALSLWERLECYETIDSVKQDLFDYFKELSAKILPQITGMSNAIIDQAKAMIAGDSDHEVTLQGLAARLAIHPVWLSHLFKKETGQTFSDYMIDLRIEKAKSLLRESNFKIYEIASKVGYQDLQYFGKLFKKRMGMSPKEYRYGK